jgi:hypothetical protein
MFVDITLRILKSLQDEFPDSGYIQGLLNQYCNIGGLSKKQLQDLHTKAKKSKSITTSQLATLEAIIKKKPTRYKSEKSDKAPEFHADHKEHSAHLEKILQKFPQHKMALFLQNKLSANQPLTEFEINEIGRLTKVLL